MVIFIRKQQRGALGVQRKIRQAGSMAYGQLWRAWNWILSRESKSLVRISILFFVFFTLAIFLRPDEIDPFFRPFCDEDGTCHEKPDSATPRTVYSTWNKEQYHLWWTYFETLKERVDDYARQRQAIHDDGDEGKTKSRPLILLGDSITESWSGTGLGIPKVRAGGVPQILEDRLSVSSGFDPIVLGMSGDQTQHLLYRLENGHMRAAQLVVSEKGGLVYDPSAVFVVMIGTNNLGSGELPEPTARGILAVVDYLLRETAVAGCHIMLFRVLPRGDGKKILPKLCPPRCSDDETRTPYDSFLPAIETTNKAVFEGIETLTKTHTAERIKLVNCNPGFLNEDYRNDADDGSFEVKKDLMPDLLHPNAEGHEILARCIQDYIKEIDG